LRCQFRIVRGVLLKVVRLPVDFGLNEWH
jgi:hypothetical protein